MELPPITIEPAFGNWLAGFIDGEGCFSIVRGSGGLHCRFEIGLRADDEPILLEIRERLGIGRITRRSRSNRSAPQSEWHVDKSAELYRLAMLLCAHPLRAKKARDFAIWQRAFEAQRSDRDDRLAAMARAKIELEEGRRYGT